MMIITILMASEGWKEKIPTWNHDTAPFTTLPTINRRVSTAHDDKKSVTDTHVFLKNLKSTKLNPKKTTILKQIQDSCLTKNTLSPVKEFIVTSPAPRRGRVDKKSIQSIPFLSSLLLSKYDPKKLLKILFILSF
jgi:hypothetical protein